MQLIHGSIAQPDGTLPEVAVQVERQKLAKRIWRNCLSEGGLGSTVRVPLILFLFLAIVASGWGATRIAFLPSFTDFEWQAPTRAALPAFDAKLQGELLKGWETEVLSRAGLSAVVFEQKLRAASDPTASALQILPADFLILSVLDQSHRQLRVFVNRVGPGMKLGVPKVFPCSDPADLAGRLPREVARYIASVTEIVPLASPAAPPLAPKGPQGKPLVCTLLEPVSAGGAQADLGKISPLIRAVLEYLVAGDAIGATLVDRNQMAKLLEEQTLTALQGLNANGATELGRLVKADLILIPFIHFQDSTKISTDLFAVDVATGRMLACRSWSGALLEAPPAGMIKELLQQGLEAAGRFSARPAADDPALRHAEAGFIVGLQNDWAGLRQQVVTQAELSIRLGDASLALASDNPTIMRKATAAFSFPATPAALYPLQFEYNLNDDWLNQVKALKQTGQLDLLHQQAKRVFEMPLTELAKDNLYYDRMLLAQLWIALGEAEKARAYLDAGSEAGAKAKFYQTLVVALMNLGRYQECVALLEARGKWNSYCAPIIQDACRALHQTKREFELMASQPEVTCNGVSRTVRFLALGREQDKARLALGLVVKKANAWVISDPMVRLAMVRARISAGQQELAISDAQCAFRVAIKAKDPVIQREINDILMSLGAKPLDALPPARSYVSIPADYRIDLIHDQTVDPQYVREMAGHLARFWGCAVQVRAIRLDSAKFSSYHKLAQALDGNAFADSVCHLELPGGSTLETVLLTQTKLISKKENYVGDVYSISRGQLLVLSDHYFRKYKNWDERPLALISAIAAASLNCVWNQLRKSAFAEERWESAFCPPPPDIFSTNGKLLLVDFDLGISPATGALLQKISPADLLQSTRDFRATHLTKTPAPNETDAPLIRELSQQLARAQPFVVNP